MVLCCRKSVIAGSGNGSGYISASIEDVVVEFTTPPSLPESYLPEHNQSIGNEVIDANKNGNVDDLIVVEKNFVEDSKGKRKKVLLELYSKVQNLQGVKVEQEITAINAESGSG